MGVSVFLCFAYFRATLTSISPRQLKRIIKNPKVLVINIATPYTGEIPNTDLIIDKAQLTKGNPLLPKDQRTPIIIYDERGTQSQAVTQLLHDMKFTNVQFLRGGMQGWTKSGESILDLSRLESEVLPAAGIILPIRWGTLAKQLVDIGVINLSEFRKVIPLSPEQEAIMAGTSREHIRINAQNSQFVVDVLWALGLAQKSIVYTEGPLGKEEKNDVGNFASTGGWNLARGLAINYLNKHELITLNAAQQQRVTDIAHNVYRPCCNNSTWFPDCNHGMAALAIIQLLVAENIDDTTIYQKLLGFNSFWFPDSYLTIAAYFARRGIPWNNVNAKEILGFTYSSSTGAGNINDLVGPLPFVTNFAGGCGA